MPDLVTSIESQLCAAERKAVLETIRSHPEWTLGEIVEGPRRSTIVGLTIGELLEASEGETRIDRRRLAEAQASTGPAFDRLVLAVIGESPDDVGAAYIRARVGGPRWKVTGSLARLLAAGAIVRSGNTSGSRYRIAP